MRLSKKRKLHKLQEVMTPSSDRDLMSEQEDLKAFKDLKKDIDINQLKKYMEEQRKYSMEINLLVTDEENNPFTEIYDYRIIELTEHKHPIVAEGAKLELARRRFFYFCHLKAPDFYRLDRDFLIELCDEMQEFYESDEMVMVINLPPRFGKSRTAGLFEQWAFGKNKKEKIMTGSYNETLSTTFSKSVRNGISEVKADPSKIVYSDIFPNIKIQRGDGAMNLWTLEGQHASYLATSPNGTATGFGASLLIVDDLIKAAIEAFNEVLLEALWTWFVDTMLSRLEAGGKIFVIMTRWASADLAGRIIDHFKKLEITCRALSMKACLNEKTKEMLCSDILSYDRYKFLTQTMSEEIVSANYQQVPVDLKGRLYQNFKTYDDIPKTAKGAPLFTSVKAYCDTADTGSDYLCNIIYGEYLKEAYVLDIYYTKAGMEITEVETAKRLNTYNVRVFDVESNNGGRGFARNVERILTTKFQSNRCKVRWFHQSQNKKARILTNATWVQDHIYFPNNWRVQWPEYYEAMFKYQKEGKNAHDDAPDATTGVAEKSGHRGGVTIFKGGDVCWQP